jgi:hypothetical protein
MPITEMRVRAESARLPEFGTNTGATETVDELFHGSRRHCRSRFEIYPHET